MFARLFPLQPEQLMQESYKGIISALWALPISTGISIIERLIVNACAPLNIGIQDDSDQVLKQILERKERALEKPNVQVKSTTLNKSDLIKLCIVIPVVEEFIFRGLITNALRSSLPILGISESFSPVISSIIFGYAHPMGTKVASGYAGYKLGLLTHQHNGSLWASITSHMIQNSMAFVPNALGKEDQRSETLVNLELSLEKCSKELRAIRAK